MNSRSQLRPDCWYGNKPVLPDDTALFLIRDAVAKRRTLIRGRLHDGKGGACAIGCFFDANHKSTISWELLEEVAAVNDSVPASATPHQRWKKVMGWLRWKTKVLAATR